MAAEYRVIHWRDIPAQIKVRNQKQRAGRLLSPRFQVAIDEAAMRAGKAGSDAYMAEWRMSGWQERDEDLEILVERLVVELENDYPAGRLRELVRRGGLEDGPELEARE